MDTFEELKRGALSGLTVGSRRLSPCEKKENLFKNFSFPLEIAHLQFLFIWSKSERLPSSSRGKTNYVNGFLFLSTFCVINGYRVKIIASRRIISSQSIELSMSVLEQVSYIQGTIYTEHGVLLFSRKLFQFQP